MRTHRLFSPSQSERFTLCRGSVNLLRRTPPRPSSKYAEEGTRAHEVLEAGLRNNCKTATEALALSQHAGMTFENRQVEIEFKSSINDALDYVWTLLEELNIFYGDAVLFIEQDVNPPITSAPGEAAGYCDIAIYSASARRLWVIDYKHGAGIAKAIKGNTQVTQYGCGFLFDERCFVDPSCIDLVTLVIIQPRAFHADGDIREYDTTPAALWDYLQSLDDIIADCMRHDAPLTAGSHCKDTFCDALATCPAAEAMAVGVARNTFATIRDVAAPKLPDPRTIDINRLSHIKQMQPILKGWLDAVDQYIEEIMRSGQEVPGFKMAETQARREWYLDGKNADEDAATANNIAHKVAALAGASPIDMFRTKLITITDAEKLVVDAFKARVGRGKKKQAAEDGKQAMAFLTLKQSSGNLTVVPADDERPAVNLADKTFGQLSGLLPPPTTT